MLTPKSRAFWFILLTLTILQGLAGMAQAVDGVFLIDQARALAGGITPGDAPGFPVTISQPGSYRLMGNLTVPDQNTSGIVITANDVTVDLNGFAIIGPNVCTGVPVTSCSNIGTGIGIQGDDRDRITVKDGKVAGMGSNGILLGASARVEKIQAEMNGCQGILVRSHGFVSGNTVSRNGGAFCGGIVIDGTGMAINNIVYGNQFRGMDIGNSTEGGVVVGNLIRSNGEVGLVIRGDGGYSNNVIIGNNSAVSGGHQMGSNVCNGALCP